MTQAFNLSQLANHIDSSGKLGTDGMQDESVSSAKLSKTGITANTYKKVVIAVGDDGRISSISSISSQIKSFVYDGTPFQTWLCPTNVSEIKITGCGSGSSGSNSDTGFAGAASAIVSKIITVTPGQTYRIYLGDTPNAFETNGNNSTFSTNDSTPISIFTFIGGFYNNDSYSALSDSSSTFFGEKGSSNTSTTSGVGGKNFTGYGSGIDGKTLTKTYKNCGYITIEY